MEFKLQEFSTDSTLQYNLDDLVLLFRNPNYIYKLYDYLGYNNVLILDFLDNESSCDFYFKYDSEINSAILRKILGQAKIEYKCKYHIDISSHSGYVEFFPPSLLSTKVRCQTSLERLNDFTTLYKMRWGISSNIKIIGGKIENVIKNEIIASVNDEIVVLNENYDEFFSLISK